MICINAQVMAIGDLRQVVVAGESQVTRQVLLSYVGECSNSTKDGQVNIRWETIAVDVWRQNASDPKYKVGDWVDAMIHCYTSEKDGKYYNNFKATAMFVKKI